MKKSYCKNSVFALVLLAGIFLSSSSVFAVTAQTPMLDYVGNFTYCDSSKGGTGCGSTNAEKTAYLYRLYFYTWNITGGNYISGAQFLEGADPITGAMFSIGNLYNSTLPDNLHFDSATGSGGGPVSFTISNGTTTYFSAQLTNFDVTVDFFGTRLNPAWSLNNITTPISFNTGSGASYSQYIAELQQQYNSGANINFGMNFDTGVSSSFTSDSSGGVSGKMVVTNVPVVPEPVSSILFVAGGAILAVRRFLKRKK